MSSIDCTLMVIPTSLLKKPSVGVHCDNNSGNCAGTNNGTQVTNNFTPQPRALTTDQKGKLASAFAEIPAGVSVKVGSADSGESHDYADQIRKAFGIQRELGTLFGWHPKGIYVGVNSANDIATLPAQHLAFEMKQTGLNIIDVEIDPQHDHPGEIEILVGDQ